MVNVIDRNDLQNTINALANDGELSQNDVNYIINYLISNGLNEGSPRDMIQVRRGLESNLPQLAQGELGFTLDERKLYIGGTTGNVLLTETIINVAKYGAVGDDLTDDTNALLSAVEAAKAIDNASLYIPSELKLYIPGGLNMFGVRNINCEGNIRTNTGSEIVVGFNSQKVDHSAYHFGFVQTGTLKIVGLKNADINVCRADHLMLYANGSDTLRTSVGYNRFYLGLIEHLEFFSDGDVGGWINENKFYGGRIFKITMDGNYSHNHNVFFSPSMEAFTATFNKGRFNIFYDVRFEGSSTINLSEETDSITFIRNWYSNRGTYFYTLNSAYTGVTWNNSGVANNIYSIQDNIYNQRKAVSYNYQSNNFNVDAFIKQNAQKKLEVKNANAGVYYSELIPLNDDFSFILKSDAALFRVRLKAYDINKNLIAAFPSGFVDWIGGSVSGDTMLNSSNQSGTGMLIMNKPDIGYVSIEVLTGTGSAGLTFNDLSLYYKEARSNPLQLSHVIYPSMFVTTNNAPTTGDFPVGDLIKINVAIVGQSSHFINTATGWRTTGIIGSTIAAKQNPSTATTVEGLTTNLNEIIVKLQNAGLMNS